MRPLLSLTIHRESRDILGRLRRMANPVNVRGMARYGISPADPLGISVKTLRTMAKEIGKSHELASLLWKSGIHEARILATIIEEPHRVTESQMDRWVKQFDSWDICDQCCANCFEKTSFAWKKSMQWVRQEEEFTRRAGFTLMARLAQSDKEAPDRKFDRFVGAIQRFATDERNYVKKGASWALRQIGKRNMSLNRKAVSLAKQLLQRDSNSAAWIGRDALKELTDRGTISRLRKKEKKKR